MGIIKFRPAPPTTGQGAFAGKFAGSGKIIDSVTFDPTMLASILKNLCASVAATLRLEREPWIFTKEPGVAVTGVVTDPIVKSGIISGKVIFSCGLPPPTTVATARHLAVVFHLSSSLQGMEKLTE